MKSGKFYSLAAVLGAALIAPSAMTAQDEIVAETVSVTEFTCDNTNHYFSNWRNNWFIQVGAGINQPFVERGVNGAKSNLHQVDRKKMTVTYNFGFGRWFSPYLGFRFNALGGALHWDNPNGLYPEIGSFTHAKHVNLNFEIMWDMFNSLGGVNSDRVFSIIPFAGLGGDYTWDIKAGNSGRAAGTNIGTKRGHLKTKTWSLPVTAGIQFRFRLCEYVDFFAEARASFYGDNWNGCAYGRPIEANVQAVGGFNFNIGGRGWSTFNECDYVSQLATLNNQVNDLRAQLLGCGQEVAALQAQLPCPEAKTETIVKRDCAPMLSTVRFKINSDVISSEEEVNIYNIAEFMKANPKENVNVVGYADKDTGTAEYNMDLSRRRAEAVANQLVEKYGISRDRLKVSYDGSDVQPYDTNSWNRIVIVTQK